MSTVQHYHHTTAGMLPTVNRRDGNWIMAEDYDRLAAENAELLRQRDEARELNAQEQRLHQQTIEVLADRDQRLAYYESALCCDIRAQLAGGAVVRAIDPEKVTEVLVERDSLRVELENSKQTLAGIASMPEADGARMKLWAQDDLSGCTEPIDATLLRLEDERNALREKLSAANAETSRVIAELREAREDRDNYQNHLEVRDRQVAGDGVEIASLREQLRLANIDAVNEAAEAAEAREKLAEREALCLEVIEEIERGEER